MGENSNLKINSQEMHRRFIEEIIKNESVWGLKLKEEDGWVVAPSNEYEDVEVMLLWSDKEHAQRYAKKEEWNAYEPTAISLESFMKDWLLSLDEDNLLVGANWDGQLKGLELEAIELLSDILNKTEHNK